MFAVEARYEEGPFPLPAERGQLLALLEQELRRTATAQAAPTPSRSCSAAMMRALAAGKG